MNIKQQLEQVIAEMDEAVAKVAACEISIIGTDCIQDWADRLSTIVEQIEADEQAIVDEVNKRWLTGKPQPDDTFVGAAPQAPDGMVLVPEVLLRQIAKWLAESADPYDKAAYAINGLIDAAKEEG